MELRLVNYSPFDTNEAKAYRRLSKAFKSKKKMGLGIMTRNQQFTLYF